MAEIYRPATRMLSVSNISAVVECTGTSGCYNGQAFSAAVVPQPIQCNCKTTVWLKLMFANVQHALLLPLIMNGEY
jgi:hypothetical protein